jgi:dephospho-CoA kinase
MTYILGLTGPIASGKSTVSDMFREHDIPVICADEMAHELQRQGTNEYTKIVHHFGESILKNGIISRNLLMEKLQQNPDDLHALENILHPAIQEEFKKEIIALEKQRKPLIVLDVPLLYTSPLQKICHGTVACICPEDIRKERAFERPNMDEEKWQFIVKKQPNNSEYENWADYLINTNFSLSDVQKEVVTLIHNIVD